MIHNDLSYRFPILKLPPPPCAVLLVSLALQIVQTYNANLQFSRSVWLCFAIFSCLCRFSGPGFDRKRPCSGAAKKNALGLQETRDLAGTSCRPSGQWKIDIVMCCRVKFNCIPILWSHPDYMSFLILGRWRALQMNVLPERWKATPIWAGWVWILVFCSVRFLCPCLCSLLQSMGQCQDAFLYWWRLFGIPL